MTVIKVGNEEVNLDPENLKFDESSLTNYLQKEGGFYNNFGGKLAKAEFIHKCRELDYEVLYGEKFKMYKEEGGSDKLAEAKTDSDPEISKAQQKIIVAAYKVNLLKQHLKAWDKNHENVQSLGHNLRKEMDKLNSDIMLGSTYKTDRFNVPFNELELDAKVTHF